MNRHLVHCLASQNVQILKAGNQSTVPYPQVKHGSTWLDRLHDIPTYGGLSFFGMYRVDRGGEGLPVITSLRNSMALVCTPNQESANWQKQSDDFFNS